VQYYLSQQIHSVVTRLVEHVDGTDAVRVAQALGLDTAAYKASAGGRARTGQVAGGGGDDELDPLDTVTCVPFTYMCPVCRHRVIVDSPVCRMVGV
jgi:DNA polymerase alpha subunit A